MKTVAYIASALALVGLASAQTINTPTALYTCEPYQLCAFPPPRYACWARSRSLADTRANRARARVSYLARSVGWRTGSLLRPRLAGRHDLGREFAARAPSLLLDATGECDGH